MDTVVGFSVPVFSTLPSVSGSWFESRLGWVFLPGVCSPRACVDFFPHSKDVLVRLIGES